ncbi:MAG: lipopolysaccharide biosynthesis protein [Cyanophyceae cyanobacterium]
MSQINTAKIARGVFWTTASYINNRLTKLIAQIVLAHLLTPEEFGIWAMVQIQIQLSERFSESSIAQVLVQKGLSDKKLLNTVYSLGVNVSVLLFILQILLGFFLSKFFTTPILWPLTACVGLTFLFKAGASTHHAVMIRQMKFRELTICETISTILGLGGTLVCALLGAKVWSFVAGTLLTSASTAFIIRSWSGYRFTYQLIPDWSVVQKVKSFIGGVLGTNLATYTNNNTDNFIIGKLVGTAALGQYNLAYQLAMLPQFVLSRSQSVNFSALSQKNSSEKKKYISTALELNSLLSALIYGIAFIAAPWIIPTVYGAQWEEAVGLFQIIIVYAYFRLFMNILGTLLNASDKPGVNAMINWILIPVSVPAYLLGAWLAGPKGVATAVALVMGLGATACFWIVTCRTLGWKVVSTLKTILLPTSAMTATVAVVYLTPFSTSHVYLQPLLLLVGYSILIAIFSGGRIPKMLLSLIKNSFSPIG